MGWVKLQKKQLMFIAVIFKNNFLNNNLKHFCFLFKLTHYLERMTVILHMKMFKNCIQVFKIKRVVTNEKVSAINNKQKNFINFLKIENQKQLCM